MANDSAILIFFKKFCRAGEGDLVEVFEYLLFCHPNSFIPNDQSVVFLFLNDLNGRITNFLLHFATLRQYLKFGGRIHGV